jgi:hypothetical protein
MRPSSPPCRAAWLAFPRGVAPLVVTLALAAGLHAQQAATPVLEPGAKLTFGDPDVLDGTCGIFPPLGIQANCNFKGDTRLNAFAYAWGTLHRADATVFRSNLFEVSESAVVGTEPGAAMDAHVSGSAEINGFLFAMGGTSASASLELRLLDVTDPVAEVLVACRPIRDYDLDSQISGSVGGTFTVGGMGGFPFIGLAGDGGIDASLDIHPQTRIIRDHVDFAFDVPVQRGRTYRLQIELSEAAHNRLLGGMSIASFYSPLPGDGSPVIPNPLDPEAGTLPGTENSWLTTLLPMMGHGGGGGALPSVTLKKGDADLTAYTGVAGGKHTIWEQGLDGLWNSLDSGEKSREYQGDDWFKQVFGNDPPVSLKKLLTNSPIFALSNDAEHETVEFGGVEVTGLTLSAGDDAAELQNRAFNRQIEECLQGGAKKRITSLYLPQSAGGDLERVFAVVEGLMGASASAGLDLGQAPFFFDKANEARVAGDYKLAFDDLRKAYHHMAD